MNKLIVLMMMFCSIIKVSTAQKSFEFGYYISFDNKKLNGFLEIQPLEKGGFKCVFKNDQQKLAKELSPNEVKEFGFNSGRIFISNQFDIPIDQASPRFFEVLVSGSANLFYSDGAYYLTKSDNIPVLLNWSEIITDKPPDPTPGVHVLLSDCQKFNVSGLQINFDHKSLIEAVNRYNRACSKGDASVNYSEAYKKGVFIGALAGYTFWSFGHEYNNSVPIGNPTFGVKFDVYLPSIKNRWKLGFELAYQEQKYSASKIDDIDTETRLLTEYAFNSQLLKLTSLFEALVLDKGLQLAISPGFTYYYALKSDNLLIEEEIYGTQLQTYITDFSYKNLLTPTLNLSLSYHIAKSQSVGVNMRLDYFFKNDVVDSYMGYGTSLFYLFNLKKN